MGGQSLYAPILAASPNASLPVHGHATKRMERHSASDARLACTVSLHAPDLVRHVTAYTSCTPLTLSSLCIIRAVSHMSLPSVCVRARGAHAHVRARAHARGNTAGSVCGVCWGGAAFFDCW